MRVLVVFISLITIESCSKCNDYDCPTGSPFMFSIIDDINEENLLEIPNQKYNFDSLNIYIKTSNNIESAIFHKDHQFVEVLLYDEVQNLWIEYGNTETDTIAISEIITRNADKCCESVIEDYNVSSNNVNLCTNCDGKIVEIRK